MKKRIIQMKRMMCFALFVLLLGAAGMTNVMAQSFIMGNLYYSINDDGVSVTVTGHVDGEDATGELVIPETVQHNGISYAVTAIGDGAFVGCVGLSGNLTLPNSVTSIGSWAFYQCSGLTGDLILPNALIYIGDLAFDYCSGFTGDLVIPNSVTIIGDRTFASCSGFTGSLTLPNSLIEIKNNAFAWCGGFSGNLTIPNSVTIIGDWAFYGCNNMEGGLTIGNSVTSIGWGTFFNCIGFTGELSLPNTLTMIGDYAFKNCIGFTGDLFIPNAVTSIGDGTFEGCSGFTGDLILPNALIDIGDYAFYNCSGFTGDLTLPNSVTSIGNYAFEYCSGFTGNLTLPNTLTEIGDFAFSSCGFTGNLTLPNSITSIGEYAFYNCPGFTGNLIIPNSMTSISNGAFCYCSGLTGSLTIPNSVTSIGHSAFIGCSSFTGDLTLPNALAEIGDWAFAWCTGFTEVYYNAANLVVLSDDTRSYVFADCNFLLFVIGEDVESLPNTNMFGYYSSLQAIKSNAIVPPVVGGNYTFDVIDRGVAIIVPCGALEAYQAASGWDEFTNIQENCPQTQTITLASGFNWISSNVEITLAQLQDALVQALPGTQITIYSQGNGNTTYNGTRWRGQLTTMEVSQMYMVNVTDNCEIVLEGMPVVPAEHPVTIHSGFNWMAFPLSQSMTLTNAFAGFVVNGDMVISQSDGSSTYNNRWRGTLTTLDSGKGYIYKSVATDDKTFTFPMSAE